MQRVPKAGILTNSITLVTRNLLILRPAQRPKPPTIPFRLCVYCATNAARKTRRTKIAANAFLTCLQFDICPAIGQGPRQQWTVHKRLDSGSRAYSPVVHLECEILSEIDLPAFLLDIVTDGH
jgi:hypothetical protein